MSQQDYFEQSLCRKCYIRIAKPTKKEIKGIVLTEYEDICENCGRTSQIVDYIEDGD